MPEKQAFHSWLRKILSLEKIFLESYFEAVHNSRVSASTTATTSHVCIWWARLVAETRLCLCCDFIWTVSEWASNQPKVLSFFLKCFSSTWSIADGFESDSSPTFHASWADSPFSLCNSSQLVIWILEWANGCGGPPKLSRSIEKFPLSPIYAVFRIPSSDPVLRSPHFRTSSYLQTKPSKESSGYRILQRGRSNWLALLI